MSAPIYSVEPDHPSAKRVAEAVQALEAGGLIAYPTDTYYGIGCDLFSKKAIERLYLLKRRDRKKPLSIICPDLSEVASYAQLVWKARSLIHAATIDRAVDYMWAMLWDPWIWSGLLGTAFGTIGWMLVLRLASMTSWWSF